LQVAIRYGPQEYVHRLLEAGADPNGVPTGEFGTPLQAAANTKNEQIARLLLRYGASVNPERICGDHGDPLCAAVERNANTIVDLLLEHGALLNRTGKKYTPPLQVAARKGLESTVRLLVCKGANVQADGGGYGTALRAALAHGHVEIARYLLENGAQIKQVSRGYYDVRPWVKESVFKSRRYVFASALEAAVQSNEVETVQLLLDNGIDLIEDEDMCATALLRAVECANIQMLEFLINKGADVRKHGSQIMSFDPNLNEMPVDLLDKFKLLVESGVSVRDYTGGQRYSALGMSIRSELWECMDFLLEAGADPNVVYSAGLNGSALNEALAAHEINLKAVEKLLARGADVNLRAGKGGTPFVNAIVSGAESLYRLFLDHGAIIDPPEPYGHFGTPLRAAMFVNYRDTAHDLLNRGVNIHSSSGESSLLTLACAYSSTIGQVAMVERLLSLGSDIEGEDGCGWVNDQTVGPERVPMTPLQAAVESGREDVVTLLLDKGARVNLVPSRGEYGNPLQAAAANPDMARLLLARGADINAVGGKYGTALQASLVGNSDAVIKMLLDAGADPFIEGGHYGSAIQAAARVGLKHYVKLFLALGVPVNINAGKHGNPLAAAAKRSHKEIVELLLDHGANVNQPGGKYGTPLQAACRASQDTLVRGEAIIQLLIAKGAEVNTAQPLGEYGSPLQAAASHSRQFTRILLEHGADPNAPGGGKFGSPLAAAREAGLYWIEKDLLEHGATPIPFEN